MIKEIGASGPERAGRSSIVLTKPANISESGFFDPEHPDHEVPEIVLRRVLQKGKEIFQLEHPIGYWDRHLGGIVVPHDLASFFTDLTSVPQLLTWLIPKTGNHLPAALLHDGMVLAPDEPQTYTAEREITRVEADRVFRDAMKDLATPALTRWLIWSTVAAATKTQKVAWISDSSADRSEFAELDDGTEIVPSLRSAQSTLVASQSWLGWLTVAGMALLVTVLGTIATLEIFDCWNLIPALEGQPTVIEFGVGVVGAIIAPVILSLFWGSEWRAGIILGIAISMLLHLMAAILIVFGVFRAADNFSARRYGLAAVWLTVSFSLTTALSLLVTLVCR